MLNDLLMNVEQSLQTEYDKLETNFEEEKSQRQELQKALKQAVEELSSTKSSLADVSEERSRIAGELQKFEKDRKVSIAFKHENYACVSM